MCQSHPELGMARQFLPKVLHDIPHHGFVQGRILKLVGVVSATQTLARKTANEIAFP